MGSNRDGVEPEHHVGDDRTDKAAKNLGTDQRPGLSVGDCSEGSLDEGHHGVEGSGDRL